MIFPVGQQLLHMREGSQVTNPGNHQSSAKARAMMKK
jgi:hypothetical protein